MITCLSMSHGVQPRWLEDMIRRSREGIPGLALRTTFITGFPGETDEEFEELLDFVERRQNSSVLVSLHTATKNIRLRRNLTIIFPKKLKLERKERLMQALRNCI